jgi:class 3 adenylate cyclase
LAGWFFLRDRPWLGLACLLGACVTAGGLVLAVRRRRVPVAAILFTDLVDSTALIAALGDDDWARKLASYERGVRAGAKDHGALITKALGDGFLVVFVGPAAVRSAIRCALGARDSARRDDLRTRAAVHLGECLVSRGDATGLAVHMAARAMAVAEPDDVLITEPARRALTDKNVRLDEAGTHELRGVPGRHQLFRVCAAP